LLDLVEFNCGAKVLNSYTNGAKVSAQTSCNLADKGPRGRNICDPASLVSKLGKRLKYAKFCKDRLPGARRQIDNDSSVRRI